MNSNYFKVCSDSWSPLLQVPSSSPPPCFTRVGPTRPPPPKESTSPNHILLAESSIRFQWIFTLAYVYLYLYMCVGFCVSTYISTKHQLLPPQILHSPLPFSHYTEKGFCVGERERESTMSGSGSTSTNVCSSFHSNVNSWLRLYLYGFLWFLIASC